MSDILLEVTRGPLVENFHRGDIAVVGKDAKLKYFKGNPYKVTYLRSALKPIQAINVFLSGAYDKFSFSDEEIAIMCASHYGQDIHISVIDKILKKIDLTLNDFLCTAAYSISEEYKKSQIANHLKLTPANNDCSGKHSGMMASCLARGYSLKNYNSINNHLQQDIINLISNFCEIDKEKIILGIDGCGVVVHAIPLYNAALGFEKFTHTDDLEPQLKRACDVIFRSMNSNPEIVEGLNGFSTELMKNTNGKLIGKLGSDGVFTVAVKGLDLGIAIKIEDGNFIRAVPPVVMRCLEDLDILSNEEKKALNKFRNEVLKNSLEQKVGRVKTVFHLETCD
ncbi:asparaginase [Terrisporobacter sp.]